MRSYFEQIEMTWHSVGATAFGQTTIVKTEGLLEPLTIRLSVESVATVLKPQTR
jgi:hypothetical protein